MDAIRIFFLLYLFCLFKLSVEEEKIKPKYETFMTNNSDYYLEISEYKENGRFFII